MTQKLNAIALCVATTLCFSWQKALAQGAIPELAQPMGQGQSATPIAGQTSTSIPFSEGERALDLGEYSRAENLFLDDLKRAGKNDPNRAYYQTGLSEALINQGRFAEAAKEYKKAQQLVEAQGKANELTARLYDGLSWLAHAQGRLDEAIAYGQKAVATRKAASDASSLMLVSTLTHLGYLSDLKGQLQQATQYYMQALGIQDTQAGPGSLTAADLQEDIGSAFRRMGDTEKAKHYFQSALQIKLSRQATLATYAPHAYWETVTFPFVEGSPNCMRRFEQGTTQLIATANGVTVAASLKQVEATKSTQVNIIIHNDSDKAIQFLPIPPSLTMTQPKIMMAPQVDPTKLATTIEKKGDRKAAWIRFWGSQATQTMTSTCIGQPGFFGYPPVYGTAMYNNSMGYSGWANRSGDMTIMHQSVPDYAAQARALARAAEVADQAHQRSDTIKTTGLGPTQIPAHQTISGSLYFDAPKMTESVVRIPIGNAVFEFSFPPK
jgi:tetratricopeptide (TPR) repeat protein